MKESKNDRDYRCIAYACKNANEITASAVMHVSDGCG